MEYTTIDLLIFLLAFAAFLFCQALFINGIFISSVGETKQLPDGSFKDSEMILYPLRKYLNQKSLVRVYYTGTRLQDLLYRISIIAPIPVSDMSIDMRDEILRRLDTEIKIDESNDFYIEIDEYRFSKYIRKPIISCIVCMASFWGLFTYWIPAFIFFHVDLYVVLLWIVNTICLSFVNYLVFKKL